MLASIPDADSGDVWTGTARPRTLLAQRSGSSYYPAALLDGDEDGEDSAYGLPPMKIALAVDAGAGGGVVSDDDGKGMQSGTEGVVKSGKGRRGDMGDIGGGLKKESTPGNRDGEQSESGVELSSYSNVVSFSTRESFVKC